MNNELNDFLAHIKSDSQEDILNSDSKQEGYTRYFMNLLAELEHWDNPTDLSGAIFRNKADSILGEIHGYAFGEDCDELNLFYFIENEDALSEIPAKEIEKAINRLYGFYEMASKGQHIDNLEPTADHYQISRTIYRKNHSFDRVNLHILTTGLIKNLAYGKIKKKEEGIQNIFKYNIWDLNRFRKIFAESAERVPIEVELDEGLPCLLQESESYGFKCILTMVPGKVLYDLYESYGTKLLENNIRYFLGIKGKNSVNKGIRNTLYNESHLFVTYNNGICGTASGVKIEEHNGFYKLKGIEDFQIVNGGQTTASIFYAKKEDPNLDLSKVAVQMKLTIIEDKEDFGIMVPRISEYSNRQNKPKDTDYSSNNPLNVKLEELSRRIYTPQLPDKPKARWYFERVRGQYQQELDKIKNAKNSNLFSADNPKKQTFNKEKVAKVRNIWSGKPYMACSGDSSSYAEFLKTMTEDKKNVFVPDRIFFEDTIGLFLLYDTLWKILKQEKIIGQRINQIMPYTLAYFNLKTEGKLSLYKIWKKQEVDVEIIDSLKELAYRLHNYFPTILPSTSELREFARRKVVWEDNIAKQNFTFDTSKLREFYIDEDEIKQRQGALIDINMIPSIVEHNQICELGSKFWSGFAQWCQQTNNTDSSLAKLADAIKSKIIKKEILTNKQINQALKIAENYCESEEFINAIREIGTGTDSRDNNAIEKLHSITNLSESSWKDIIQIAQDQNGYGYDHKGLLSVKESLSKNQFDKIKFDKLEKAVNDIENIKRRFSAKFDI